MDREAIENRIREFFRADNRGVVAVYLFGSVARGTQKRKSDIDVAVLLEKDGDPTFEALQLHLSGDLERELLQPVDLVVLNSAPVDLVHRVLRAGRLVLDRNPSARIRFEVRSRNQFFDLQPILARYRRMKGRSP